MQTRSLNIIGRNYFSLTDRHFLIIGKLFFIILIGIMWCHHMVKQYNLWTIPLYKINLSRCSNSILPFNRIWYIELLLWHFISFEVRLRIKKRLFVSVSPNTRNICGSQYLLLPFIHPFIYSTFHIDYVWGRARAISSNSNVILNHLCLSVVLNNLIRGVPRT